MERLTKPAVNKTGRDYVSAIGSGSGAWPRIIQRLAEYENTGLEPEAVRWLWAAICDTEGIPQVSWTRMSELARADKEGRIEIRPCKLGDTVYEIRYRAVNEHRKKGYHKNLDHGVANNVWIMMKYPDRCYVAEKKCVKSDYGMMGKSVFLTREKAEAALKERESNG